jgi:hypothetical protein
MKWLTLIGLLIGFCLLALAAYLYPRTETVDTHAVGLKLAEIPIAELRMRAERIITIRTPDSEEWRRLTTEWGAPTFIAAAVSQSPKRELACFTQTGLTLKVTDSAGKAIPTHSTAAAPYGYVSQCADTGIEFTAPPGSELFLHVTRLGKAETEGELVVLPYWRYEKDRLVGGMIAPVFKRIAVVLGIIGIFCLGASLWLRQRQITKHVTG